MATPALFRFAFQKDATTWYGIDPSSKVVVEQNAPYWITEAPEGWDETLIQWTRSRKYKGIAYRLTEPYQMVKEGAAIVRYAMLTYGPEGPCRLYIEIRTNSDWVYEYWDSADIDLSKAKPDRKKVECNLLESGINSILLANESTPQEIPLLDLDCKRINIEGLNLNSRFGYILPRQGDLTDIKFISTPFISNIFQEGVLAGQVNGNSVTKAINEASDIPVLDRYFYRVLRPQTITISIVNGSFFYYVDPDVGNNGGGPFKLSIGFITSNPDNGTSLAYVPIWTRPTGINAGQSATSNVNATITISRTIGDRLILVAALLKNDGTQAVGLGSTFRVINDSTRLELNTVSLYPNTFTRAYHYWQFFEKMVTAMAGPGKVGPNAYLKNSALQRSANYDSYPYGAMVTCGDALRELDNGTNDPAKIKSTFEDMFQDASVEWQLALTQNNERLDLVPLRDVFKKNYQIIDLGEVSDLTWSFDEEMFNLYKVGGQKIDYDQLNGRDEVNQGQSYEAGKKRTQQIAEWLSNYRKDPYGIEFTRSDRANKLTTDAGSDNDTFVLGTDGFPFQSTNYYVLFKEYVTMSGVLYPQTMFNLEFTGKRKMLRNGGLIRSQNVFNPDRSIKFKSADKNDRLISNVKSGTIVERADVPVNTLAEALYLPILFNFTAKTETNLIAMMKADPHGYISFTWQGVSLMGFVMDIGVRPANHKAYECTVLAHPDCDITQLLPEK